MPLLEVELISAVRGEGVTVVVIEHIMKAIMSLSAEGSPQDVSTSPPVIEAYLGTTERR